MRLLKISSQSLLPILIGQQQQFTTHNNTDYRGELMLAADHQQQLNLPNEVALAIVKLIDVTPIADQFEYKIEFVSLIHPISTTQTTAIDDQRIHREPYNWFGPQALVIEKKMQDFINSYDGPLSENGGIPRAFIPDNIAEPIILSDKYWHDYATFVYDPDGSFAQQIQPIFKIE